MQTESIPSNAVYLLALIISSANGAENFGLSGVKSIVVKPVLTLENHTLTLQQAFPLRS